FGDEAAEKNTFRANNDSIPLAIFSLAKNGISPPLTLFMPDSLDRIRSSNVKTMKHGTGESTKVTVMDVSDFPNEDDLDQATWTTCYNRFLTFVEVASGEKIFRGFAAHFNEMLSDPALATWFQAYRAFDKRVRAQFFTKPYIIDVKDGKYRLALQSAKDTFLLSYKFSAGPSGTSSSGSRGRGGKSGKEREGGHGSKPYDRAPNRKRPLLCFRCGRSGHSAVGCEESDPSRHRRAFVISATRDGLFRLSDRRAVCMGFNCGKCEISGRAHALHICSLCGDAHHGAVECTCN
ncbi:hypothetical protein FB45DRAFT_729304, partial [Roridomyces roridus]